MILKGMQVHRETLLTMIISDELKKKKQKDAQKWNKKKSILERTDISGFRNIMDGRTDRHSVNKRITGFQKSSDC